MPKKAIEEMYLRDWFAGMVMQALATKWGISMDPMEFANEARDAYVAADAMMKVRMEQPGEKTDAP